jgi:hypothetical protein
MLEEGATPKTWRLHRAKFKPNRKLSAYFDVTVGFRDRDHLRHVVVSWTPADPDPDSGAAEEPDLRDLQGQAIERGLAAPFRRLFGTVPEWGMRILVSPVDPRFPQLISLCEPERVRSMLASVYGVSLARTPSYRVSAIRYRPNERHVLRYDSVERRGRLDGTIFAKMARGRDAGFDYRVGVHAADWLEGRQRGVHAVRPLACVAENDVLLYPLVHGVPLSQLFKGDDGETGVYLQRTGALLRALHELPSAFEPELKRHDPHREIKLMARASEHVQPLLPDVGARITEVLSRAGAIYDGLPNEPAGFIHGDFKADHILVDGGDLTVLDFDNCQMGDPALDLGKFLADLDYWNSLGGAPSLPEARRAFLEGYGPAPDARLRRARLYEALVLVKSTVRRIPLFDPGWALRTAGLIERAEALLRATETSGAAA